MQFLFEEIKSAATDKQASKQQREEFGFKRYLVATRVYADHERKDGADDEAGPSSSKAPAKQVKKPKVRAWGAGHRAVQSDTSTGQRYHSPGLWLGAGV